ncbi:tryptophan synthase subunit alpha [Comamonas serinivorans]|uniref:tryptophan synthase subunit alpha n=1 Tax=Comamonas serinivorans TaxID=1082851 RepID=UPI001F01FE8D|nr:tryptophan synthase subunit alpha [Comamonas serinivorans]
MSLGEQGRQALIVHVVRRTPSREHHACATHVLVEVRADVLELGVPFSDPSVDELVLQVAGAGRRVRMVAEHARSFLCCLCVELEVGSSRHLDEIAPCAMTVMVTHSIDSVPSLVLLSAGWPSLPWGRSSCGRTDCRLASGS